MKMPFPFPNQSNFNPTRQFPNQQISQNQQFKQYLMQINDPQLQMFATMARKSGISEQDINNGLEIIKKMR